MVHAAFWLSALSAVIFLPVFRYVENSNERHRLDAELSLQQREWEKQEKIYKPKTKVRQPTTFSRIG